MERSPSFLAATLIAATLLAPFVETASAQTLQRRDSMRAARPGRGGVVRQPSWTHREPAAARGYADGYEEGRRDARGRGRYDPIRSRDYRQADQGYYRAYGPRDAYRNNYRFGFRQGYDAGYRSGRR
jgi:hypothetical protein